MTVTTRRLALSMLASALVLPATSLQATTYQVINPWVPRQLTADEAARLRYFQHSVSMRRREIPGDVAFIGDHVRIRLAADHLFERAGTDLSEAGIRMMTALAARLDSFPDLRAEIVVHHHFEGQSYRSFIFTSRRAQSILATLVSRTIRADRLLATGLGASFPIDTNQTAPGRTTNRRVEILIRPL